jgi:hypothetical protein
MKFSRQLESMETTSQGYFPDRLLPSLPSSLSLSPYLSLPLLWKIIFLNLLLRREESRKRNSPERHKEFDGDVTRERKYSYT